jgi:hypothetical protein
MAARDTSLEWNFHKPHKERARTMNDKLLQPAATITASLLAAMSRNGAALPNDAIRKAFVHVYRQLELSQQDLEKPPQEK